MTEQQFSFNEYAKENRIGFAGSSVLNPAIFNKRISINIDIEPLKLENQIIEFCPMVKSAYCMIPVPEYILNDLNTYLDKIYDDPDTPSRGKLLVGEIKMLNGKKGKQLVLNMDDELVRPFSRFLETCSRIYLNNIYSKKINDNTIVPIVDEIWSVHQFETDYNPLHQHSNSISEFGLSSFLHLKLPEQLLEHNKSQDSRNGNGFHDGRTVLTWDTPSFIDVKQMKFASQTHTKGETGVLYLFPQWLHHTVYPFFGEGERRTVAANVGVKFT